MKSILLIDDDHRNIFALTAVLKSRKFDCLSAVSALEGLDLLKKNREQIGIVLLDMMMPDMDGYELLQLIRGNEDLYQIPVIAVTAQAMEGDREKAFRSGATDYISKPVDVDRLVSVLERFLS